MSDPTFVSLKSGTARFRILAELNELHLKYRDHNEGKVASYIPELSKADPAWFGIAIATADGHVYEVGDYDRTFTVQSIANPFMFGLALEDRGFQKVRSHVGVEPSGDSFNAVQVHAKGVAHNPMINAGAITVASLIRGKDPTDRLNRVLDLFGRFTGHDVLVDMKAYISERSSAHRNRAIAHLLHNFGILEGDIDAALDLYFQQCSTIVTCRDLAVMAATLANAGTNPLTGKPALDRRNVKEVLSVMFTCGMYSYSGQWVYSVGLPAKSGVGGGILAVVPGQMGIGVFSPALDPHGNSLRGIKVCEELSRRFCLHLFQVLLGDSAFEEIAGGPRRRAPQGLQLEARADEERPVSDSVRSAKPAGPPEGA